jgi:hypothetical protein
MTVLPLTHNSPDTAYYIDDYPYGFKLRCIKRVWIEYKPKFGFRVMAQTSNPRKSGLVWNKPQPGIYCPVCVMYLDDDGHVQVAGIHVYNSIDDIRQFAALYGEAFTAGTVAHKALQAICASAEAYAARKVAREATETVMYRIEGSTPVRIV